MGHKERHPMTKGFWERVDRTGDCWTWAGPKNNTGYGQFRLRSSGGKRVVAHRVAWEFVYGDVPEGMDLDHVCHNRGCVNPAHLRLATRAQNISNQITHKDSSSGIKGASWNKRAKKWSAQIVVNRHKFFLGYFETAQLAHAAYMEEAKKRFGEFANPGCV